MPTKCRDSDPPLGGDLYARGTYNEGGTYMLVYTVPPQYPVQMVRAVIMRVSSSHRMDLKLCQMGCN